MKIEIIKPTNFQIKIVMSSDEADLIVCDLLKSRRTSKVYGETILLEQELRKLLN